MASTSSSKRDEFLRRFRRELERGDYAEGDRIPSEHELRDRYGVSRNTIREAISVLVQDGRLDRIQGKGTFVTTRGTMRPMKTCLVMTRATGDMYQAQTLKILRCLQDLHVLPSLVDLRERANPADLEFVLASFLEARRQRVSGMIIDGSSAGVLTRVEGMKGELPPIASVNSGLGMADWVTHQVLADYQLAIQKGTAHLKDLGHQRILLVLHRSTLAQPGKSLSEMEGVYGDLVRGYHLGLAGLEPQYLLLSREFMDSDEIEALKALLRSPKRPTAVMAAGDYRAKVVVDIALQLGLRIPDDLAVVGMYDTPWARLTEVPLTSINLQLEAIGERAVQRLFRGPQELRSTSTIVEPELVVRESCGSSQRTSSRERHRVQA